MNNKPNLPLPPKEVLDELFHYDEWDGKVTRLTTSPGIQCDINTLPKNKKYRSDRDWETTHPELP